MVLGAVLLVVAVVGVISLTYLGGQVSRVGESAASVSGSAMSVSGSVPPCVIVANGPLGHLEFYIRGATVAQCEANLASARGGFGADTSSSQLYLSYIVPTDTPVCTVGVFEVHISGLNADTAASQVCASLSP